MSGVSYPRNRIDPLLLTAGFPESYRIMPARYLASPLGTGAADSRFASRDASYTVLYASPDFATAFVETVVRDRLTRQRDRVVALKEITERAWVRVSARPGTVLTLLDLRRDGCTRIGAPTDVVHARNHAAGRAFGRAIHAEHGDVEGLLHVSRLTGEEVLAVFDRGLGKLASAGSGMLKNHPELPEVLARHGIGLVEQERRENVSV